MKKNRRTHTVPVLTMIGLLLMHSLPAASSPKPPNGWQDCRRQISPRFAKKVRASTRYIILHGSEAGLQSSLRTLSKGKKFKGTRYRTCGGHAHYLIDRNGKIYYLLDEKYRADHAGLSLWDGLSDISSHSLGIELVAYVNGDVTDKQYESLTYLLTILRMKYKIEDKNVLTHAHIAYGRPNPWFPRNHRGRKRDGINLDIGKLGLRDFWDHDPDVKAGRLMPDPLLSKILYSKERSRLARSARSEALLPAPLNDQVIRADNTAWTIAGGEYDSPETLYILPGGRKIAGDQVAGKIGWNRLPNGTRVMLNQTDDQPDETAGPIHMINADATAWSYAGPAYRSPTTFYITPEGQITRGDEIKDWDQIPEGTRMLINYRAPQAIGAVKGKTAWSLARQRYRHPSTVYFKPPNQLIQGSKISDFGSFPKGSLLFLPLK